jgi:glutamine amidotransferase
MIGILDLDLGNLRSVANAVDVVGHDAQIIQQPEKLSEVDHLIIPGVGCYRTAIERLRQQHFEPAIKAFAARGNPVLGICLGMQLLSSTGDEGGRCTGLDLVPGHVQQFDAKLVSRIPHVGWNHVAKGDHPVLRQLKNGVDFYFVHSFHFVCADSRHSLGTTDCGQVFTSIVGRDNVLGFQFHPEKSQSNGLGLLERFCDWDGIC